MLIRMVKSRSCIYLVSSHPLFNENDAPLFDSFDKTNSVFLYKSLALNYLEIFESISTAVPVVYCFDERDKDFIPQEFRLINAVEFASNISSKSKLLKLLSEKYFNKHNNNLVIFTSSISISSGDILKSLDLLNNEDETFIIGNSNSGNITFFGFNKYNGNIFREMESAGFGFNNFLKLVCKYDVYIHVLNGSMSVNNLEDFRELYRELSKKESFSYCSRKMHEKFTHLFIEYKELLK
jgi:hypothetical protein